MRILVLGAGATGGYIGGRMAEGGLDVSFLMRDRRRAELARDGLKVKSRVGDIAMPVNTVAAGALEQPFDVVLLSCKAYDLKAAMEAFAPAVGEASTVLPVLNGLAHLEALAARFGAGRVLGGCCYGSFRLDEQGVIQHVGALQRLVFGERGGGRARRTEELAALLKRTRLEAVPSENIVQEMWEKLVLLAALATVTTLARGTIGEIMAAPSGEAFALSALAETAAVATAAGHAPSRRAFDEARALLTQRGSGFAASMFHDMRRGAPTEADHIIGDLIRHAAAHGVAVPVLRAALANLEAYETRRASGG